MRSEAKRFGGGSGRRKDAALLGEGWGLFGECGGEEAFDVIGGVAQAGFDPAVDVGQADELAGDAGGPEFGGGGEEVLEFLGVVDPEGFAHRLGGDALGFEGEGLFGFFEPDAEPGDGSEFGGRVGLGEKSPLSDGFLRAASTEEGGDFFDFLLALEGDGGGDVGGVDRALVGDDGELGEFGVESAKVVADEFGEGFGGGGLDRGLMFGLGTFHEPGGEFGIAGGFAFANFAGLGDGLIDALIGRKRAEAENQSAGDGFAGLTDSGDERFELLAVAGDEFVRVADYYKLATSKHGEGAQFIENSGEWGFVPLEIGALRILELGQDVVKFLGLEKRIGADKSDDCGNGRFCHG